MSTESIYAIGTMATWAGWACLLRAAYLAGRLLFRPVDLDPGRTRTGLLIASLCAVAGLLIGPTLAPALGPARAGAWRLPIVWFVMPFAAWAALGLLMLGAFWGARWLLSIPGLARTAALKNALFCLAAAGGFYWFVRHGDAPIQVLKGTIPLSPTTALLILAAVLASTLSMVAAQRASKSRRGLQSAASHAALLVGSVVFGLPFAWLLLTSFKEDRDMSSPEGLVWVPRVQQTVPFMDPDDPLIETDFRGTTVQGSIVKRNASGGATLDVLKPMSMRGMTVEAPAPLKAVPKDIPLVTGTLDGKPVSGKVVKELDDGRRVVEVTSPSADAGRRFTALGSQVKPIRNIGLRLQNYSDALEFLPPETLKGLVYLKNTLILVFFNVLGTLLSSSLVAYAFARMRFPGKGPLFVVLLSTMMLPAAVTLLPTFLIFRSLGWVDTLLPLWVPSFFGSAFNIFLLRQFFLTIPMELEDAAKMDGCTYLRTYWQVMLPQVKPALAVVAIWTFMGAWNNFMGPLVYINSPENLPISYALQLFNGERSGEPGLLMAFATMTITPVLLLFFFAQRYFIEGVTLSGLGGK